MIEYSPQSMRAFTALYRPYNDIDIYVEDRSLIGLYERIFDRILEGIAKITSVTPLGGRDAVLAEARRLRRDKTRQRFFLVDGDFFWILGSCPKVRGLYTLKCYSFENFAFERVPVLNTAFTLGPQHPKAHIESVFASERFEEVTAKLFSLFEVYAICRLLNANFETVNFSVVRLFQSSDTYLLDAGAIKLRIREILCQLRPDFTWAEIVRAKQTIRLALRNNDALDARFISGKSYLGGILLRWFQKEVDFRGNRNQLISMILQNSSLSVDPGLAKALRRVARSK